MKKQLLSLTLIGALTSLPALGGENMDDFGREILSCFHPLSEYRSIQLDWDNRSSPDARGISSVEGKVRFAGGFTENRYQMRFTLLIRTVRGETEMKVVPGSDSSPFPPGSNCYMRGWN